MLMKQKSYKYLQYLTVRLDRKGIYASMVKDLAEALVLDALSGSVYLEDRPIYLDVVLNGHNTNFLADIDEFTNFRNSSVSMDRRTYRDIMMEVNFEQMDREIRAMIKDYAREVNPTKTVTDIFIHFPEPQLLEINIHEKRNAIRGVCPEHIGIHTHN